MRMSVQSGTTSVAEAAVALVVVVIVALLQVGAFDQIMFVGGAPDLVAVAVVCAALARGPVAGAAVGFAAGFAVDVAGLGLIGTTSLALTPIGYVVGAYGERLRLTATVRPVFLVGITAGGSYLARLLLSELLGLQTARLETELFAVVPTALLSTLLALIALPLLRRSVRYGRDLPEGLLAGREGES